MRRCRPPVALLLLAGTLLAVALLLTGCQDMGRAAAKLYGYQGDPFPGQCAPESFQAGKCIPVKPAEAKK